MELVQQLQDAKQLIRLGRTDEAISAYEKIINDHGNCSEAATGIALSYARNNDYHSGYPYIEKTVRQNPASGELWYFYARYLVGLMRYEDALKIFDIAIVKQHSPINLYLDKIETLSRLNRFEEALALTDKLLAAAPNSCEVLNRKAGLLNILGRNSEASDIFRKLLELKPDDAFSFFNLSHMGILPEELEDQCDPEHSAFKDSSLSVYSKSALYFARAFEVERQENYDEAFQYYNKANRLIHDRHPFDKDAFADKVDRLIEIYNEDLFERFKECGDKSGNPVFILGMPRSGTTLLEQIISAHPEVNATGENGLLLKIEKELIHNAKLQRVGYPEIITHISESSTQRAGNSYMSNVSSFHDGGVPYFTDKTPLNFMHVGLIHLILPNAKIIHARRNPLDTCLSCYFTNFSDDTDLGFSFDLESTGFYFNQYSRLMDHWQRVLPDRILNVHYEDLLNDQEAVTRNILDHIGLSWNDNCINFQNNRRAVNTASKDQIRKPLYQTSRGRWQNYSSHLEGLQAVLN